MIEYTGRDKQTLDRAITDLILILSRQQSHSLSCTMQYGKTFVDVEFSYKLKEVRQDASEQQAEGR